MAPRRPARADLIFADGQYDPARITGVLISREEGTEAQVMAMRALTIDAGWDHDEAVAAIVSAQVTPGRWFKVPNRHGDGWNLESSGTSRPASGATPGVLFRLRRD